MDSYIIKIDIQMYIDREWEIEEERNRLYSIVKRDTKSRNEQLHRYMNRYMHM